MASDRRTFLRSAAAGGALALLPSSAAGATLSADIGTVTDLVTAQLDAQVLYATLATAPGLSAAARADFAARSRIEATHAAALLRESEYEGGPARVAPSRHAIETVFPALAAIDNDRAAYELALEVETAEVQAGWHAAAGLIDEVLTERTAAVVNCDAQQLALTRIALGADPIPTAFEPVIGRW